MAFTPDTSGGLGGGSCEYLLAFFSDLKLTNCGLQALVWFLGVWNTRDAGGHDLAGDLGGWGALNGVRFL